MLKHVVLAVVGCLLGVSPALAATYDCADKAAAAALAAHDEAVATREANIAEMKAEIAQSGGTTDDQKKVLKSFEDKLGQNKEQRATLIAACASKAAP